MRVILTNALWTFLLVGLGYTLRMIHSGLLFALRARRNFRPSVVKNDERPLVPPIPDCWVCHNDIILPCCPNCGRTYADMLAARRPNADAEKSGPPEAVLQK